MEKIGLATSGWDQTVIDLVEGVYRNFGEKVSWILLSREPGETYLKKRERIILGN